MASLNPSCFYWVDDVAEAASNGAPTIDKTSLARGVYDEQVRVSTTVTSLEGYPYFIESVNGKIISGRLDKDGYLPRVHADAASRYKVYWGDEALAQQGGA